MRKTTLDRSLGEIFLLAREEEESQKSWNLRSKRGRYIHNISEKGSNFWAVDFQGQHWSYLHDESITPPMNAFLILTGLPESYNIQRSSKFKEIFIDVKDIDEKQNYFTSKLKNLEERLEKFEKIGLKAENQEFEELKCELENIKKTLINAIILRPIIQDVEGNKEFIEEQKYIEELKDKYEGEILAFTRQDGELKLVAHSVFKNELMDLISNAYKSNDIHKDSEIFYR